MGPGNRTQYPTFEGVVDWAWIDKNAELPFAGWTDVSSNLWGGEVIQINKLNMSAPYDFMLFLWSRISGGDNSVTWGNTSPSLFVSVDLPLDLDTTLPTLDNQLHPLDSIMDTGHHSPLLPCPEDSSKLLSTAILMTQPSLLQMKPLMPSSTTHASIPHTVLTLFLKLALPFFFWATRKSDLFQG